MAKTIYILNGPNLNLLGQREPQIYGTDTLDDIKAMCESVCEESGYQLNFFQSNVEGELVDMIQEAGSDGVALLINPAAYSHTSVALYDAIKAISIPVIEVHLSQPASREAFRQTSYVAQVATGTVSGFGINSYLLGLKAAILKLK